MAKVLVIEDNPAIGLVMRIALMDEGHQVDVKQNAQEGLSMMKNGRIPDLVVTDLFLSGMGGRELIRKMRSDERLHDVPAVIITGSIPCPEILPQENEYQGLFIKPFDLNDVLDTVSKLTKHTAL